MHDNMNVVVEQKPWLSHEDMQNIQTSIDCV